MSQSRRDFVKNTSIITGGLLSAPLISNASFFNSNTDDTIK
ncbi:twin-arginine translocation signal domain-containing protein [Pseudarcicella hirudinis]